MTEAIAVSGRGGRPPLPLRAGRVATVPAERLATLATAAAIALLPLLVPRGPANTAPIDLFIAIALTVCLVWAGTSSHRWRFPYVLPVVLLIAGGAVGALAGPVPRSGFVALVQDLVVLAWCWAVVNLGHTPERLKILLTTWVYSSIGWAVLLFAALAVGSSSITGQTASEGSRTSLTFADPSYSANYYFISIMIIWATGRPRHRGLRLAAYVLLIAALISTGSNSGIVALIVGTAVAGLTVVYRRFGTAPAVAALAFLVLGCSLAASSISLTGVQERAHESRYAFVRDGIGRGDKSVAQRDLLLRESVDLYQTSGPLGAGPASTATRLRAEQAPFVKEAHNDYLAALIERGALGFLGAFLLVSSLALRTSTLARPLSAGFAAVVSRPHALVGAVAGTMVVTLVYELLHVRHVWTLFAFVAVLSLWGGGPRGSEVR